MNKKYVEFSEKVRRNILDYLPSKYKDCRVAVHWQKEEPFLAVYSEENISPMIPLMPYFRKTNGFVSHGIMQEISDLYVHSMRNCPFDARRIYDFNSVKCDIYPRLFRKKGNKSLMDTCPHKTISDLVITYYVEIMLNSTRYTVDINNEILELYEISAEELHELSLKNMMKNHNPLLTNLNDIVQKLAQTPEQQKLAEVRTPLMVLSDDGGYGAVRILDDNLMDVAAEELGEEFYVFPSSIRELVLCPLNEIPPEVILETQKEINTKFLLESEVLSDNVYIYNSKRHKLKKYVKPRSS